MINIRSITYSLPNNFKNEEFDLIKAANRIWDNSQFFIRTKRITLAKISSPISDEIVSKLSKNCELSDIRWFDITIDPYESKNSKELFNFSYNVLKNYDQSFINVLCIKNKKMNSDIIDNSIKLIKKTSYISLNGKDNFRLGLSSNIGENCPFFPFSTSKGNFSFSIALELTQEINNILKENDKLNLKQMRDLILSNLKIQIDEILNIATKISKIHDIEFAGFDFSLAPIIDQNGSILSILKYMGINAFDESGTMFATAYLTNILKYLASIYKSVGFSGVMYSLLEDFELCKINNEKPVKIEDLIKLSTMCGCGLDMIPIAEDVSLHQIKTLILEVGAISCRLNKPLGIRILPIPNTKNGDEKYTSFNEDADFISNTKIVYIGQNQIIDRNIEDFEFINF